MAYYEAPDPKRSENETDPITVLFIHGLESSKETWQPIFQKLENKFKIFAIDLRGHGECSIGGDERHHVSIWHFVADIDRFVKEKGLKQVVLVSHSMGARIAMAYARRFPEKVRNLIIEDMDAKPREPIQLDTSMIEKLQKFQPIHDSLEQVEQELEKYDFPKEKFQSWLKQGRIKQTENGKYFIGVHPYVSYLTHNACLATTVAEESFRKFSEQRLPVLLLKATTESSVSSEELDKMRSLLPTMQVKEIPHSTHSIHKTQSTIFAETLATYLLQSPSES
jgi:2-succinyl-6-hydroxy-2,4-cyclohexadiene-1-carboxylate synthase